MPRHCPLCGAAPRESVIVRGAIVVTSNPTMVFWHGKRIPLSPTEAQAFRLIAIRGRATFEAIDEAIAAHGSSPATRSVVIWRIRQKFMSVGSPDPFIRSDPNGLRLVQAEDRAGTVIGLKLPAEATARLSYG